MGISSHLKNLNPQTFVNYTKRCSSYFGAKFVFYLSVSYFSLKGYSKKLIELAELPYYELSGQDSESYQLNKTISGLPFSLKGFIGVISDILPLFGYYKTSYLHIYTGFGLIASIIISILPYESMKILPELPALVFFFIQLEIAAHDLINEGKYVMIMNIYPQTQADIVTYIFLYITLGYFIPSISVGLVADNFDVRYLFLSFIPLCASPLIMMLFGCFPEEKVSPEISNKINFQKVKQEWRNLVMASAIATCAVGLIIVGVLGSNLAKFIYTLVVAACLACLSFILLPPMVARANVYLFLCDTLYTDIDGPLSYFYVAGPECVENGTHFSYSYYRTYTALIGIFAQFIGLFLFQIYFSKFKIRNMFWITTVIRVTASMFDFILVKRWNLSIGIPDQVFYLLGHAIIYNVVYIMDYIPMNTLMSKLCSKGVETTMFAILAGFANFGLSLAGYIGLYLAEIFGVKLGQDIACSYQNLPYLILLSHGLLPILNIPLTFILLPPGYLNQDLVKIFHEQNRLVKEKKQNKKARSAATFV